MLSYRPHKFLDDLITYVRLKQRLLDHFKAAAHVGLGQLAFTAKRLKCRLETFLERIKHEYFAGKAIVFRICCPNCSEIESGILLNDSVCDKCFLGGEANSFVSPCLNSSPKAISHATQRCLIQPLLASSAFDQFSWNQ